MAFGLDGSAVSAVTPAVVSAAVVAAAVAEVAAVVAAAVSAAAFLEQDDKPTTLADIAATIPMHAAIDENTSERCSYALTLYFWFCF